MTDKEIIQQLRDENNHLVEENDRLLREILDLRHALTEALAQR